MFFGDYMYPYHNKIKQRIKNGELIGFEFTQDYGNIGECLLLFFSSPPFIRPVRPHKYAEYTELLKNYERKKKDGNR